MNLLESILLGVVQGLTEFLPVSSSGHLVAFQTLFGIDSPGVTLEVCLHFGTLLAILVVFGPDLWSLIVDGWRGAWLALKFRFGEIREAAPGFYTCLALVVGTVPAGLAGTLFEDTIEPFFEGNLLACGGFLVFTGFVLAASRFADGGDGQRVGPGKGLLVGLAQALALFPGVSRSGTTIAAGLFTKLDRETAARFAFLLAVPALLGAQGWELVNGGLSTSVPGRMWMIIGAGTVVSAFVGVVALKILLPMVRKGKLHLFAFYCVPAGLLLAVLGALGWGAA